MMGAAYDLTQVIAVKGNWILIADKPSTPRGPLSISFFKNFS